MVQTKAIGKLLLEYGLIRPEDLEEGLALQNETGLRLGEALARLGKISMDDIEWVLSKQLDIPFVMVEDLKINPDLVGRFEKEFLIGNRILPVYEAGDHVAVVTDDPFNQDAITKFREKVGKKVCLSTGNGAQIEGRLKRFFQKEGLPRLTSLIEATLERIRETCFYRFDFSIGQESCAVGLFGFGVARPVQNLDGHFTKDDLLQSFDSLNIPVLYDVLDNSREVLLSVFPVRRCPEQELHLPAIIGRPGLTLPENVAITDCKGYKLDGVFQADRPLPGYPFVSTRKTEVAHRDTIYTVDSAPDTFVDHYVRVSIPSTCADCQGHGCPGCLDLGVRCKALEGIYSSHDLNKFLGGEQDGQN
ncbi:MAG: hypothetical protein R3231_01100 [bacterium]|nr:hypothetical protein [bacterium]